MKNSVLLLLCLFTGISCSTNRNVDFSNYPIITTARELEPFYGISLDTSGAFETGRIRKFFDGSYEVKYSYDLRETKSHAPLFYSIAVSEENTLEDARESFDVIKKTFLATNKAVGLETEVIDEPRLPADQHYCALRTLGGHPAGLFLIVRKERYIYSLILFGLYNKDLTALLQLIRPKLDGLENFTLSPAD